MCIIIHKKAGSIFPRELYQECFTRHGDGVGLAYVKDGSLVIDKGMFGFEEAYSKIQAEENREMVIHFRNAPFSGTKTAELCHPFLIEAEDELSTPDEKARYQFAIAHNGSFSDYNPSKDQSDTQMWVDDLLRPHLQHDPYFLDSLPGMYFIHGYCGLSNKLAIMRYDTEMDQTEVYIINEKQGTSYKKCWFSNDTFRKTHSHYATDYNFANPSINYQYKDQWMKSDKQGWYWCFVQDMWVHSKTHARKNELSHRIHKPPADMRITPTVPTSEYEGDIITLELSDKKRNKELRRIAVDWFRKKNGKGVRIDIETVVLFHRRFVRNAFNTKFIDKTDYEVDSWIIETVMASPDSDALAEAAADEQVRLIMSE